MSFAACPLTFDVGDVVGEQASLAGTYYPARTGTQARGRVVDVSPDPAPRPACYRSCPDITTLVLADSGHCHNMASTRYRLWRRLLDWTASVTCAA